jgi:hypothetical protein
MALNDNHMICDTYRGQSSHETKSTKTEINDHDVEGTTTLGRSIRVPKTCPYTNTAFCHVLQVSYHIEVKADGCKVKIPVVIAALPLKFD